MKWADIVGLTPTTSAGRKQQVQDVVQEDVGHPLDEARMGAAFKSVRDVIYAALEKAKEKVAGYERVTWTQCYLSVTDWFRELAPKPKARATAFLNAVELSTSQKLAALHMPIRLRWEVTSGYAEAQYEWKAVEYAVRQSGLAQPALILSGGRGSVQVTGLDDSSSVSAPLSDGEALIKEHAASRSKSVEACEAFYKVKMPVEKSLTSLFAQALENSADDDEAAIRVVAISGFYYAAVAAKLIEKGATVYQYLKASNIAKSLVKMRDDEETKPADVAAAVRFHMLLHKMFDAKHLHKVEILFARDWKLGDPSKPEGQTPYRTTWGSGWWIDQVTKLFEEDLSHERDRSLLRHAVFSPAHLLQEQRLYESELRLASRIRGKDKEILEPSAKEAQAKVSIRPATAGAATSVARAVGSVQHNSPLVIYDGPDYVDPTTCESTHKRPAAASALTKLLQHAGVTRAIDGVAAPLVPLVVPVSDLVALLSGSALVRTTAELQAGAKATTGEGPAGDLLDDWMRQRFNASNPVRYEMLKDAMARGVLMPIMVGMEAAARLEEQKARDQLDAYVVVTLGSCAHVVLLCSAQDGAAAGARFEGCSVLHATET